MVFIPQNSWWFDTGCSVHITNYLQGFQSQESKNKEHYSVYVGNGSRVNVESVGQVMLKLSSGYVLVLNNVLYVPSMRRNLLSATKFVQDGFSYVGEDLSICFYLKDQLDNLLGYASLNFDLWQIQCTYFHECHNVSHSAPKRMLTNDNSSILWHRKLGHISKERMMRLVKLGSLPNLSFHDLEHCIDCYKGKTTSSNNKSNSKRSSDLLEIIHTDVCSPFPTRTICGNSYFVLFIDDFSRYTYLYLISEKNTGFKLF